MTTHGLYRRRIGFAVFCAVSSVLTAALLFWLTRQQTGVLRFVHAAFTPAMFAAAAVDCWRFAAASHRFDCCLVCRSKRLRPVGPVTAFWRGERPN